MKLSSMTRTLMSQHRFGLLIVHIPPFAAFFLG
jgi:hypothetical protein